MTRITGTLHEEQYTFSIISRSYLLRMKNISDKSHRDSRNTHCMFNNFFFFLNRAVYEVMWKNIVERCWPQKIIWHKCIACWIPNVTNTHTLVVQYSSLFYRNNGSTNEPQWYSTLHVHCLSCIYYSFAQQPRN